MARSIFTYFGAGHKKARKYCRKGLGNRILASLYQPLSLLGTLSVVFAAGFAASDFSFNYMLKEADDAVLEKSFDGAENGKTYLTTIVVSTVCLGILGSVIALIIGFYFLFLNILLEAVPNPDEARTFGFAILGALIIVGAIAASIALMTLQASLYIINKNKILGAGDVLYNAFRFVKAHGAKLFLLDLLNILAIGLMVAPYVGVGVGLTILAGASYGFFPVLFRCITYGFYAIGLLVFLFYGGQVLIAMRYSIFDLLSDEADATKYVVVYPQTTFSETGKKGKFVEVVNLDDEEVHPMEPISKEEEVE